MTIPPRSTERLIELLNSVNPTAIDNDGGSPGGHIVGLCREAARHLQVISGKLRSGTKVLSDEIRFLRELLRESQDEKNRIKDRGELIVSEGTEDAASLALMTGWVQKWEQEKQEPPKLPLQHGRDEELQSALTTIQLLSSRVERADCAIVNMRRGRDYAAKLHRQEADRLVARAEEAEGKLAETERACALLRSDLDVARAEIASLREANSTFAGNAVLGISAGCQRIISERRRQIAEEGWTAAHDDQHANGELACAAASYAYVAGCPDLENFVRTTLWPESWGLSWFKPSNQIRNLDKAGALIAAEIDRLIRAEARAEQRETHEAVGHSDPWMPEKLIAVPGHGFLSGGA